ncbi:hypothetical protein ANN_24110 [Periplaneta americana]|uniref:Uncharacterized protein n=1 Tax=Periplaneta americana TaxID=6978 RepID=A0ABQ8S273_PERAM|nr:hypothetical protein ANN_24110 [Periplaneta americana]
MAGLCEGSNEPPGSLEASKRFPSQAAGVFWARRGGGRVCLGHKTGFSLAYFGALYVCVRERGWAIRESVANPQQLDWRAKQAGSSMTSCLGRALVYDDRELPA